MDYQFTVTSIDSGHLSHAKNLNAAINHASIRAAGYNEELIVSDKEGVIGIYYPAGIDDDGEYCDSEFHWKIKKGKRRSMR